MLLTKKSICCFLILMCVTNFYLTLFLSGTFYLFFTITSKRARHASTLLLPHDFTKLCSASALQCSILHVLRIDAQCCVCLIDTMRFTYVRLRASSVYKLVVYNPVL